MELGISQQELADLLGYRSRSTITKIEAGENGIPKNKIRKFAAVLDTTEEYILKGNATSQTTKEIRSKVVNSNSHKTVALILAGGKSTRNLQNIPNQFINVLGKPEIIYVLEAYQRHPLIDDIYVVCLRNWENILTAYSNQYGITKLRAVLPAGETGVLSVKNGIDSLLCANDDFVILQESTRPLITEEIISKVIYACRGSAIICEPMRDIVQFIVESGQEKYVDREKLFSVQSPEVYEYSLLKSAFDAAAAKGHSFDETCCAMMMYNLGYKLNFVEGNHNNIKVVRQEDITILNALLKNRMDLM